MDGAAGVGMGGAMGGAAGKGSTRDSQLSINPSASDQISRLAETLFAVEEVVEATAGVQPLTRREGGIIGSAALA